MIGRRRAAGLLSAVFVVLVLTAPSAGGLVPTVLPSAHAPPISAHPVAAAAATHPPPAGPIPTCNPPPYPIYNLLNGVFPITPQQTFQIPCAPVNFDEVHATFTSSTPGSATHFNIPVHLPENGVTWQSNVTDQLEVGFVVRGDPFSEWHQSYAEVAFQPINTPLSNGGASVNWTESVHVLSLRQAAFYQNGVCPLVSVNLSWNNSYECEVDLVQSNSTFYNAAILPGNSWVNVSFAGTPGSSSGTGIWVNDTATPALSTHFQLDSANTGTYNFTPYFSASCANGCLLNWSMQFGLGYGFNLCPLNSLSTNTCNSYSEPNWRSTQPTEFGAPEYYQAGGYNGDYYYFAPESASGACNNNAPLNTVAFCFNQDQFGGTGYYPSFSFNGTVLDFGANYSWTTEGIGGSLNEFLPNGALRDIVPFFVYTASNTSRAGFAPSGASIGVTDELQDLGHIISSNLTYSLNGGTPTTVAMGFVGGTASDATYSSTIPSGPDGEVNYTITGLNGAGATIVDGPFHVARGPLPTFSVVLTTQDPACAQIVLNGTTYSNGSTAHLLPGTYAISALGCYPWVFSKWTLARGLTISPYGNLTGTLEVTASGSVEADWGYVRPFDSVLVETNPSTCGQVIINGTDFLSSGQSQMYLDSGNYTIGVLGCAGEAFSGWTFLGPWSILGNVLTIFGNGTLTANYVAATGASSLIFETNPSYCGGVLFEGAGYISNSSISLHAGTFNIAPDPCSHWGFSSWSTTGSISASGGSLTVNGGGTLTENNYVLTEVKFVSNPSNCGNISWDSAVQLNDAVVVVSNNSTHAVFATPCAGYYLIALTGDGGIHITGNIAIVNGSGTVTATFAQGQPTQFLGFLTDPSNCGAIVEGGTRYVNSNYTYLAPGTIATVVGQPCSGYGFVEWITFGEVTISGSTAFFNGSGAIEAVFAPLVPVFLYTSPGSCGSISVGGTTYVSNSSPQLTENVPYPITATPCTGYAFTQWTNTSSGLLAGGLYNSTGTLTIVGEALLTADFAPIRYDVTFTISPPNCGSVVVSGANELNGTVLAMAHGTYSLNSAPCTGDHLLSWTLTGNLSVVGTHLYVNGSGTVEAIYRPVYPTVSLSLTTSSFEGEAVPFEATVAVPIPPYTYNYTWSFGDGSPTVTTPVNFTSHAYANAGTYAVSVTVQDPLNRNASANGSVQIITSSLGAGSLISPLSLALFIVAIIGLIAIVVLAFRRPRAAPSPPPEDAGPGPAASRQPVPEMTGIESPSKEPPKP